MSFIFENKKHSVNNKRIDDEHKSLFNIINEINKLIISKDISALPIEFDLLEERLEKYFKIEEDIAKAINFDFSKHRRAHQFMLKEYQQIRDRLIIANGLWSKGEEKRSISNMRDYLSHHIVYDGKELSIILAAQYYSFSPEAESH